MRKSAVALASVLAFTLAGAANAVEIGSPQIGGEIADDICAECHVVRDDQVNVRLVGLPTFREIANNPQRSENWLRTFMVTPHYEMPDFVFTQDQIDNILAYIKTLKVQ
ncbi:MAG: cytochrome c [Alphaproteobacteria bacterium]|jgi:mono/diheme cytochrome c family protein|nr:cytochrome c [Alphaproteobacteria bacterium]